MHAHSVPEVSVRIQTLLNTRESTPERNHTSAMCVGGLSVSAQLLPFIRESTLGKNHTHVLNVAKTLVGALISLTIRESTLVKNYKYDSCGKPFSTVTNLTEHQEMHIEECSG